MTMSGVPIETVDVNLHTLSELLRLYLQDKAAAKMDWVRNGQSELSTELMYVQK